MRAMHYAGALHWRERGVSTTILGGWAACCSGDRAERIRELGAHTRKREEVTCKACLRVIARATIPTPEAQR